MASPADVGVSVGGSIDRRLSQPSQQAIASLDGVTATLDEIEATLGPASQRVEAYLVLLPPGALGRLKSAVSQCTGQLEKIQCKSIDTVMTGGLVSGKEQRVCSHAAAAVALSRLPASLPRHLLPAFGGTRLRSATRVAHSVHPVHVVHIPTAAAHSSSAATSCDSQGPRPAQSA